MKNLENLNLTHSFFQLGQEFYQAKAPDPVSAPYLVDFNTPVAELIGLDPAEAQRAEFVEYFSGNRPLPGYEPLAMAYTGHQFGSYNPNIGDGRAVLLGEVENGSGLTWDICLKGCGPTAYSRGFDGRATLRSSIREYLGGEAMHGLGIPSTRSLAVLGIGELIYRETPEPAAVLVRVSDSHVRFGSFQKFHFTNRPANVTQLADYVIRRHYPELENEAGKYQLFFRAVVDRTAKMIALWQSVGFIHGVMNTDNMSITGCTFDYGPYGFMDRFNPAFTPNLTDAHGRYAYGRQPEIGLWNLSRLAEALSHLIEHESILEELERYQPVFNRYSGAMMGAKLGLEILDSEFNTLVGGLFKLLSDNQTDYTVFFRSLSDFPEGLAETVRRKFKKPGDLDDWLSLYRRLIEREDPDMKERKEKMDRANPRFILRNYLLQRATEKALKESDFSEVERLRILLEDPFSDRPEVFARYGIDADTYAAETPDNWVEMQLSCSA